MRAKALPTGQSKPQSTATMTGMSHGRAAIMPGHQAIMTMTVSSKKLGMSTIPGMCKLHLQICIVVNSFVNSSKQHKLATD